MTYDFFTLYGLSEYTAANPKFGGFLPVKIKTAKLYNDEANSDADSANPDIEFVIPLKIGEISDGMSVSYARRGSNTMGGQLTQAMSETLSSFFPNSDFAEEVSKVLLAKYDPGTLNKKLEFDFILPLVNPKGIKANFIQETRNALGALQGMGYPRGFGLCYAPMVKVDLGGLYKNFKGFITDVNFRTSEELINVGGEMFPLVITGSIKFINVFMYTWNDQLQNVIGSFNLKENPSLLFGFDPTVTTEVMGSGSSYGSAISPKMMNDSIKDIKEAAKIGNMPEGMPGMPDMPEGMPDISSGLSEKTKESLRNSANPNNWMGDFGGGMPGMPDFGGGMPGMPDFGGGMPGMPDFGGFGGAADFGDIAKKVTKMNPTNIIENIGTTFNTISKHAGKITSAVNGVNSILNSGKLFNVNLDSLSGITRTVGNIGQIVNRSVGTLADFSNTMHSIVDGNVLEDIKGALNITKSAVPGISNMSSNINGIAALGGSLIGNTTRNLQMGNVGEYYSNFNNFNSEKKVTGNNVMENAFAGILASKNMMKLINSTSNIVSAVSKTDDPISALSALGGVATVASMAAGLSEYKSTYKNMYEKASALASSGDITPTELSSIKKMYDIANKIDIEYISNVSDTLETKLNNIVDKIGV